MQLTFDADVEAFRAEFVAFLDEHLPDDAEALERSGSSSHVPDWARRWQRLMFDNGWLLPGYPPEFGGRNATILQQYVHQEELTRRRCYLTFNPQGVGIISASLISFGTPEQQQRWAVPILRAEMTASLGMSEPGAGSDLASLRTRAVADGDEFVVNGQKVWTSGAHDADVLLTFVRTDPNAAKHKGISVLMIPTDLPGVVRRPFASVCDESDVDFNEVFFNDVRVPAENLVGPLNGGWQVASGSLGHERNMLWLSYADRLEELVEDLRSLQRAGPGSVRHAGHGQPGASPTRLGGAGPCRARRRGRGGAVGAQALRLRSFAGGIRARAGRGGRRRLRLSGLLRAVQRAPSRPVQERLVRALRSHVRRHHRRRHIRDSTQHHRPAPAGPTPQLGTDVYIDYEVADKIATITLNRPEAANAQNIEFLDELDAAWTRAAEDHEVAVIILRANGKHFSAGHDLRGGGPVPDKITLEFIIQHEHRRYLEYTLKWRNVPKPSIAAVQGRCISGGLLLCWPCDLILAADDALFSDPVVLMGIGGVEYHGHTWELGPRKAKEILFTGRAMTADEVASTGMVNKVVPRDQLDSETRALAEQIAKMPTFALRQAKRAVNQTLDVQGFYAAIQSVFDIHQTGHGNALSVSGWPVLVNLDDMKANIQ